MAAVSIGFAVGKRHCTHVAQVAGPFGVMTTIAVTLPTSFAERCWAKVVAVAATVAMQAIPAMMPNHRVRLSLLRPRSVLGRVGMAGRRLAYLLSRCAIVVPIISLLPDIKPVRSALDGVLFEGTRQQSQPCRPHELGHQAIEAEGRACQEDS
jgi:hypothetical protein